ncbi:hypothetical protein PPYR_13482 [Photinus pyralis]|nr:GTPase Era, mitochondrial-like [Photinus pyralis]XP_031354907.1 GTPase Era, mitochondrial-like [Photinus pyralis]KAB0793862.1 hypothetical protein PPYR_13482 [Photinus pyralis]
MNCFKLSKIHFRLYISKEIIRKCNTLQNSAYKEHENSHESQSLVKVAVIGMPNAGKSTFINYLMDRKVCPTSSKVHTTRTKASAIFTHGNTQIVFLDTPGLVNNNVRRRHNLENSFIKDSNISLQQCDLISVIHDVSNSWTRNTLDIKILRLLEQHQNKESFLVLNKVDVLKSKRKLLDIVRLLTHNSLAGKPIGKNEEPLDIEKKGWPNFKDIFMVSALTGTGLNELKQYLIRAAKPGKWLYPEEMFTDQSPEKIIENTVKATLLDFLPQEIPYQMKPQIELYEVNDGIINTVVIIKCVSDRVAKLVAGLGDGRLRQITESTQRNLQSVFQHFVRIRIVLESKEKKIN